VDEIALITRVKNLARLKMLTDEMAMRASTSQQMGIGGTVEPDGAAEVVRGRVLLIDDHPRSAQRMGDTLARHHEVDVEGNPQLALQKLAENDFDLAMVSLSLTTSDGLRVCSQIRSLDRSRHTPVIILVEPGDDARLLRGLDMGVNDYVMRPIDRNEMLARVRTQIKRKRHSDTLRNSIEQSVEAAITDSLTGLHNRRYLESHLRTLMSEALRSGRPLSVLVMDIDHFKHVNDTYGHQGGDLVLKELGRRLQANTRSIDLSCRYGGEEFVVIMPDTEIENARFVAERLRSCIAAEAFRIDSDLQIPVTSSIGIATLEQADDTCESVLARADKALYAAKRDGRNRVVADAA
jgi:two-component system cell cycle response regulator